MPIDQQSTFQTKSHMKNSPLDDRDIYFSTFPTTLPSTVANRDINVSLSGASKSTMKLISENDKQYWIELANSICSFDLPYILSDKPHILWKIKQEILFSNDFTEHPSQELATYMKAILDQRFAFLEITKHRLANASSLFNWMDEANIYEVQRGSLWYLNNFDVYGFRLCAEPAFEFRSRQTHYINQIVHTQLYQTITATAPPQSNNNNNTESYNNPELLSLFNDEEMKEIQMQFEMMVIGVRKSKWIVIPSFQGKIYRDTKIISGCDNHACLPIQTWLKNVLLDFKKWCLPEQPEIGQIACFGNPQSLFCYESPSDDSVAHSWLHQVLIHHHKTFRDDVYKYSHPQPMKIKAPKTPFNILETLANSATIDTTPLQQTQ